MDLVGWLFAKVENFHCSDLTIPLEALENRRSHLIKLSEDLEDRMVSNQARYEVEEHSCKEWKAAEKHPAPDTATEKQQKILFQLG